jgi:hypothetical protein
MESKNNNKQPKSPIAKKVPFEYNNRIPFLDRPLPAIMSILRHMQYTRNEKEDKEVGMYYTPIEKYPFDALSEQQVKVYGYTFSKESNADALQKISPIYISQPIETPKINQFKRVSNKLIPDYQNTRVSVSADSFIKFTPFIQDERPMYDKPIGPLSFLMNTVPQAPNPIFVDYLNKI